MPELTIVREWETGFGVKYQDLSCGHSRRKPEGQSVASGKPDRDSDADSNLPDDDDVVWCWYLCHEGAPRDSVVVPVPGENAQLRGVIEDVRKD